SVPGKNIDHVSEPAYGAGPARLVELLDGGGIPQQRVGWGDSLGVEREREARAIGVLRRQFSVIHQVVEALPPEQIGLQHRLVERVRLPGRILEALVLGVW